MTFVFRFCSTAFAVSFIFLAATFPTFGQIPNAQSLILNQPIEGEIKGGEAQFFAVQIGAGQTARVEIVQKGIEISLAAHKPGGERFLEAESPSGSFGNDLILVTAAETGEYKVAVEGADPRAGLGKYQITLTEIRPTVAEDNQINEAALKIRQFAKQAETLRGGGTREERRLAADKYQQIIELLAVKKDKIWEICHLSYFVNKFTN